MIAAFLSYWRRIDYNELITDIQQIPFDSEGIANNVGSLLKHAKYLEGRKDVNDPFARGLLDTAPSFIRKQIERLELHLDDDVDIIAWISRNLMELSPCDTCIALRNDMMRLLVSNLKT